MSTFKVLTGINYVPQGSKREQRAEPGDTVSDLAKRDVDWMLRDGIIEPAGRQREPSVEHAYLDEKA